LIVNAFIVNENSDISDTGQLIFICDINIAFHVYKELTSLCSLKGTWGFVHDSKGNNFFYLAGKN